MKKRLFYILSGIILFLVVYYLEFYIESPGALMIIPYATLFSVLIILFFYWHGIRAAIDEVCEILKGGANIVDRVLIEELTLLLEELPLSKIPILNRFLLGQTNITNKTASLLLDHLSDKLKALKPHYIY